MNRSFLTAVLLYSNFFFVGGELQAQLPAHWDQYVDSVLSTFKVPGLTIAVVKDGRTLLAKGYGYKRLGDSAKIDAHTLFPIASNSKAFTAMALAILVEKGKLDWDTPVIAYLPRFRMSDPWVTAQLSVRDLLVHHSGIPAYAGDILLFPPSTLSRSEIVGKLGMIPLKYPFRTHYAYDNILYVVAGELISAVSGMGYEDFIRTCILEKAGMTETLSRYSSLATRKNIATPHVFLRDELTPVDQFVNQEIGDAADAAGGICSNAIDMAKWLLTLLDSGRAPNQTRLVPAKASQKMFEWVTPQPLPALPTVLAPAQPEFYGYGMGLRISNYGHWKTIGHGGVLDGYVSQLMLVPALKLGVVVLTNQETSAACMAVIQPLLDYYMQNPPYDWLRAYRQVRDSALAAENRDWAANSIRPVASSPRPNPSKKYTGRYTDPFYGDLLIEKDDRGLHIQLLQTPQFKGDLEPFQYETFTVTFQNPTLKADSWLSFKLDETGEVQSCTLKIIDPTSNISFDGLLFTKKKNRS